MSDSSTEFTYQPEDLGEIRHVDHFEVTMTDKGTANVLALPRLPQAEHGALIDPEIEVFDKIESHPELQWSKIRKLLREPFSEFFGVFIMILFGDGVVAQVVLSGGTKGNYQSISWGWG
jgi:hypothetical protein